MEFLSGLLIAGATIAAGVALAPDYDSDSFKDDDDDDDDDDGILTAETTTA